MRIESVSIRNFKRFTDLTIIGLPDTARLVLIVGPNGCGKSSLFDAFLAWYRDKARFGGVNDEPYFRKDREQPFALPRNVSLTLHGGAVPTKGCLYLRTAHRNDPDFNITTFSKPTVPSDAVRFSRVIDNDQAVSENYQRLVYQTMTGVYNTDNDAKTVLALREELIGEVRQSMQRVFGDLMLRNITDPLGDGAFFFEKGAAASYHYKNLSAGEKAAFDLVLDLHIKKRFFLDAIYAVDEIEAHLHTRVQGTLLREMVSILPDACQLWTTTHSLGVLRAAQSMAEEAPGTVCLIDFESMDVDTPCTLKPSNLGRVAWGKLLSIALDDLSERIAPEVIVVCEGSSVGGRRKDFDAEIYNRILGSRFPQLVFVSGGSGQQVTATGASVGNMLGTLLPKARIWSLADRDDRSNAEVAELASQRTITLNRRHLESYMFADDVIEALATGVGQGAKLAEALAIRQRSLDASISRGNPPDDLKSASGDIYTGLKELLGLTRCGNNKDTFMRDTLADLISPPMPTYEALKAEIVDQVLASGPTNS